jgi:TM2 domain-containing membrane protein YozV
MAMFCAACGKSLPEGASACPACGAGVGAPIDPYFASGAVATSSEVSDFATKKIAAGVCGILLGSLGVHKFILGLTVPGIIMLLTTLLTFGFGALLMSPIGLIEGIIYLTKTDQEFYDQYAVKRRGWF